MTRGLVIDLFAGGGGASTGIEAALGRKVDIAINHDAVAIAVHTKNHPRTRHLTADIWEANPAELCAGRPVDLLWASPDCTHFSRAKGDVPKEQGIRSLAWVCVRWARAVRPTVICLENVREFQDWGPLGKRGRPLRSKKGRTFRAWVKALEALGYVVDWRILDASHYGAPTRRLRLFVVARCDGRPVEWPAPTHGPGLEPVRTAAECIDWSIPCPSIFERKKPLAENTQRRIAAGIRRFVLDDANPFIVKFRYDSAGAPIDAPLPTITGGGSNRKRTAAAGHALGLCVPSIVDQTRHNAPKPLDLPLGVVATQHNRFNLCQAWIVKHFGGMVGHLTDRELGTIKGRDSHALAAATLLRMRGTSDYHIENSALDMRGPVPTVSAQGFHVAEVRAFLTAYYSSPRDRGQALTEPMRTATAKARLGIVTVAGDDYQIADIGMRMLEPHELLAAQFGDHSLDYSFDVLKRTKRGKLAPLSKADRVRLIGNSVPPDVAAAVVRANVGAAEAVAA